jgi:crotonobetainyl-CoA:carnitine CoA-transferase CaiB-like acyl-CoA transferase
MSNAGKSMLEGYRVLDLTDPKGYYAGQLLGNLGADVLKVERPGGDPGRNQGPFFHDVADPEKSLYWKGFNTNKRGITLNLEAADGRMLFQKMAATADAVLESFSPGYLDGLGLGYPELAKINPKLVLTSVTPFGQSGPHCHFKGSDLVCWAMGGLLFVTGDPERPPVYVGQIPLSYLLSSMDAAMGTALALYWRATSGQGQHVDVSIQDAMIKTAWMIHEIYLTQGKEFQRGSSRYSVPASPVKLRMTWPARDGHIMYLIYVGAFGAEEDKRLTQWAVDEGVADDFLKGIDWYNLDWRTKTYEDGEKIQDYFVRMFEKKPKTEIVAEAVKRGVQIESINTPKDILKNDHFEARGYWQELEHPELGPGVRFRYPRRFVLSSETDVQLSRRAPLIGEHNGEIYLGEMGLKPADLVHLKEVGVI